MRKAVCCIALTLVGCMLGTGVSVADLNTGSGRMQLLATAFSDVPARGPEGKAAYVKDNECELTSELAGTWTIHEELWEQLTHEDPNRELKPNERGPMREFTMTVASDPKDGLALLDSCIAEHSKLQPGPEWLAEFKDACRRTLWCGTIGQGKTTLVVAIVQWRGNLTMVVKRKGQGIDVIYLSIARDKAGDDDLLFMREDHSPSGAYKRKKD